MKLTCNREKLASIFQLAGSAVAQTTTKPILRDAKLVASDSQLELAATDLEIGIRCFLKDVDVKQPGAIVIPPDKMNAILRETPDEELSLELSDNVLTVTGKKSLFRINGLSPEDFPEIPDFVEEESFEIDGKLLSSMIRRTAFACAAEKIRFALNGVLFKIGGSKIETVATDGKRLAYVKAKYSNPKKFSKNVLIPTKAMQQFEKILAEDKDAKIQMHIGENRIFGKTESAVVYAQLLEGHFPNYEEVIPKDCDKKLELDTQNFLSAIRRAALMTDRDSISVKLKLEPGNLVLSSRSAEGGEAKVELDIDYSGEVFDTAFDPRYIMDFLKVAEAEKVFLEVKEAGYPALLREGKDYLYVMMPVDVR